MSLKYKLTTIPFFLLLFNVNAQWQKEIKNKEVAGIYLTQENFKNNKLTCNADDQEEIPKIKLKQFFISPEVSCININSETIFYKDSIFAIHLSNGEDYRFLNRVPVLIADTSFLYIYTHKTTKTEYKQSGPHRRSKKTPVTYYYFSTDNHNNIYRLNLTNICKYLNTDNQVYAKIKTKFTSDEMLYAFDQNTGLFALNDFLLELKSK